MALNFGAVRTTAGALLLLPTACRSEEAPRAAALFATKTAVSAATRVQDGVTLLEHTGDAFERAPRLTLDPSPIATLGAADTDGTYDLTFAFFVALLPDGRVATLSQVGSRLLIFPFGRDGATRSWSTGQRSR